MEPRIDESSKVVLPRGYLHGCLLLLLSEARSHGYDLYRHVHHLGLSPAGPGVVYRALHELEQRGLVVCTREPGAGRPDRLTYEPTPSGLDRLRAMADEIRAVERFLSVFDDRADRQADSTRQHAAA